MSKIPAGVGPKYPHVVVLIGATGDLARRRLLPGLFHLSNGFIPGCRIIGVSLDEMTADAFRDFVRRALQEHATRKVTDEAWNRFAPTLDYVSLSAGASALKAAVEKAEKSFDGAETRRLHYLSVPPNAALSAVRMLGQAGLAMEAGIRVIAVDVPGEVFLDELLGELFAPACRRVLLLLAHDLRGVFVGAARHQQQHRHHNPL